MRIFLPLLLLLVGLALPGLGKEPLPPKSKPIVYYGIANETTLPFVEIVTTSSRPEIKSGVLKNLAEALFKEMDSTLVLVLLPKNRVAPELLSGELSLVCYAHESWFPEIKEQLLWSKEITTNTNLLISAGKKKLTKLEDLKGKSIGTIVNYVYQKLDPLFAKGLAYRENATNNESNIQKLVHGRIDYMVLSNLEYEYHKKFYPQLTSYDFQMDVVSVKCAVSKKSGIDIERLNQSIETLRNNGTLSKIFKP